LLGENRFPKSRVISPKQRPLAPILVRFVNVRLVGARRRMGDTMTFPSRERADDLALPMWAYRHGPDRFAARNTGIRHFQVNSLEKFDRAPSADGGRP